MMEARKACEAAALEAQAATATDPAGAFDKLTGNILPADFDEPKRKALTHLMVGLRELRYPERTVVPRPNRPLRSTTRN